ncbi:MAG: leucine-rich repeat domain-containing protein [Clostridia bacterium]|nr:leucine-rich repeat domain-containing protein [Clostridia bacterium]MBN2884136.1 leucine-rich repeat domain-containing protein [Clostridia bacterium]
MKKLLIVILTFSLLLTILSGCGNSSKGTDGTEPPTQEELDQINSQLDDNSSEFFKFDSSTGTIMGFKENVTGITEIEIPSEIDGVTVKGIGDDVFKFMNLTSVVLPDNIESIGATAFHGNNLSEIILPDSLTSIGFGAFWENQLTEITIPTGLTEIATAAFRDNKITKINFSDTVKIIRRGAFQKNLLVELTIPSNIVLLESGAFQDNLLENLVLNEGLEEIGGFAFDSNNLTSLTIPASVKLIGSPAAGATPEKDYRGFTFKNNMLTDITILGTDVEMVEFLMGENNYFRDAYSAGGPGIYKGEQMAAWEKVSDN